MSESLIFENRNCRHREGAVRGNCSTFVVISMKTTWLGGSSKLFKKGFHASTIRAWHSSMMKTLYSDEGGRDMFLRRSFILLIPFFLAALTSLTSKFFPSSKEEHSLHVSQDRGSS
ncbi:hypothetical protein GOP47_0025019 [Adiantum capillus-veneris]|uniref:Transmembrane protein n=1 Tax=Adiantum capillus-veneris TaxID=13818 RepID=A0A9D4U527_ADICA|nr:hypothetical protein GOP47_0025019 [Adiantum capillus-veneris]